MNSLEFKHWILIIALILGAAIATGISIYQFVDGVKKENDKMI